MSPAAWSLRSLTHAGAPVPAAPAFDAGSLGASASNAARLAPLLNALGEQAGGDVRRSQFSLASPRHLTVPPPRHVRDGAAAQCSPLFAASSLPVNLIHCIYASRATTDLSGADIQRVLERSRHNNAERGITGMLLFIEGSFFQVLEGDAKVVDEIYETIARDARHDRVTQIIREPISKRCFGAWSMGFTSVERTDVQQAVGENDFFGSAECLEHINAGRARKLLIAFGSGRWRTEKTGIHRAHARVG